MITKSEVIEEIKRRGYWFINIHPNIYKERRIESRSKVKEIVENAVVELRGWDYPHFHDREGEPYHIENGVEKMINWEIHLEFWRMTQSANFIHLLALREDWIKDFEYRNMWSVGDELKGNKLLGILGTLYTLTEIFEFAKRLTKQNIFDEILVIDINLHDMFNRQLFVDSPSRIPFFFPRIARSEKPWKWKGEYKTAEFLEKSADFAFEAYMDLIDLFQWENPPKEGLKNDQQKFLEGKI